MYPTSLTGHRNLLAQDESKVKAAVKEVFQAIREEHKAGIRLFCGLAPGADLWAAECLDFNMGDQLVYVQVLSEEKEKDYNYGGEAFEKEPEIHDDEKEEKFKERLGKFNDNKAIFEFNWARRCRMAHRASRKIQLINPSLEQKPELMKSQFVELAKVLVQEGKVLVALWDGLDGGGAGGTADVARLWHTGKGLDGSQVNLPLTSRQFYHILCPRETNLLPIQRKDL